MTIDLTDREVNLLLAGVNAERANLEMHIKYLRSGEALTGRNPEEIAKGLDGGFAELDALYDKLWALKGNQKEGPL